MSEFGLRINNFAAGSIIEKNIGVRDRYDITEAMLINSLFKDYMVSHGLDIYKGESTRDIICITFKYGSRTYEEEIAYLNKRIKSYEKDKKISEEQKQQKIDFLNTLKEKAIENKDKYIRYTKDQLRILYYTQGVDIFYNVYSKRGKILSTEKIHYKMLYRSTGKAKVGSCMFIREELYDIARDYLYMGIKLPKENAPIIEIGAYSSLVASSIVGKVKIDPKDILILKDVDSFLKTNVVSIETDKKKHCHAVTKKDYKLKNTMFDGQALIDHSLFPTWGNGYILLRQHMFKAAAFDCYLQQWFKDYYGDKYENAVIKDMWGNEHKVTDIKMVTTDNAIKWIKFNGITYDYWCERVKQDNDNWFGIVKTAHPSKLGNVQFQSYQMVNALDIDTIEGAVQCTKDYIYQLKNDINIFLDYLKRNSNFSNDFEVLIALVKQDPEFEQCSYFKDRRDRIIQSYIANAKMGRIINNGDNLTIVGSPYAMLLYTVGEDPESDPTFNSEDGCIQCFTERFEDGEYLAEFRSPFNSCNNLGYLHNHYDYRLDKYFNIGKNCIAINMIHTDFQDKNNGADQDSDSIYTTNQKDIVAHAKYCIRHYPTIVNNIPKEKNTYTNSLEDFAKIDNKLAASQMSIGSSSNLAQIALSYSYTFSNQKYKDYVCILSVLAQCAIDNAKRTFDININEEIDRIQRDMDININGYPIFWKAIKKKNDKRNGVKLSELTDKQIQRRNSMYNPEIICPMNSLYNMNINPRINGNSSIYPIDKFLNIYELDISKSKSKKVEELINKYSLRIFNYNKDNEIDDTDNEDDYLLLDSDFDQLIKDIREIAFTKKYLGLMSYLINRAFIPASGLKHSGRPIKTNLHKNRPLLLKTLYELNSKQFLKCFSKNINS